MQFIQANNVVLNCSVSGNPDGPPLVFINSLGTDWRIWDSMMPYFETTYRVIRYDKRGHGLSDCPQHRIRFEIMPRIWWDCWMYCRCTQQLLSQRPFSSASPSVA